MMQIQTLKFQVYVHIYNIYRMLQLYYLELFNLIYLKTCKMSSKVEVECFRANLNTIKKLLMVLVANKAPSPMCMMSVLTVRHNKLQADHQCSPDAECRDGRTVEWTWRVEPACRKPLFVPDGTFISLGVHFLLSSVRRNSAQRFVLDK